MRERVARNIRGDLAAASLEHPRDLLEREPSRERSASESGEGGRGRLTLLVVWPAKAPCTIKVTPANGCLVTVDSESGVQDIVIVELLKRCPASSLEVAGCIE
jgi:hypothetical protein